MILVPKTLKKITIIPHYKEACQPDSWWIESIIKVVTWYTSWLDMHNPKQVETAFPFLCCYIFSCHLCKSVAVLSWNREQNCSF